jgi:hypothetical protein
LPAHHRIHDLKFAPGIKPKKDSEARLRESLAQYADRINEILDGFQLLTRADPLTDAACVRLVVAIAKEAASEGIKPANIVGFDIGLTLAGGEKLVLDIAPASLLANLMQALGSNISDSS